jgi:Putative DNA-binding domain
VSEQAVLAHQQQALLQALFTRPGTPGASAADTELRELLDAHKPQTVRGLAAYRTNGHALAERSLLAAYPVVAALIGGDNFALLARDLWHRHPPQCGDLALWGDALPGFLHGNQQLADAPYLSDVARAEWALHRAAGAPDAVPDLPSFARLGQEDPQGLTLTLATGTTVIASLYPVASLISAHLFDSPSLDDVAQRLRDGHRECVLVWRQGLRPRIAGIAPPAAALVQALLAGADLPQALDAAGAIEDTAEPLDFSAWLTAAVTDGLVIGVHSLATYHPRSPTERTP